MCNCKGWDVAWYVDKTTIQQHWCRTYGDCGHPDNSIDEAADRVAESLQEEYDWHVSIGFTYSDDPDARSKSLLENITMWRNRTHPDYLFYTSDNP